MLTVRILNEKNYLRHDNKPIMKTLLLQTDIVWESPERNRDHAMEMIYGAEAAELIVLPEMFTTGFTMAPERAAERDGVMTLEWMLALARDRRAAVAGSVAVEEGGRYFNRLYFVKPDGSYATYDKRHLFTFAGEHRAYSPGGGRVVVEHMGVRILLQVCYDLRFPVFARNGGDYDMILYAANWPQSRIGVWETLLRARAIENVSYVAGVNRVGRDPESLYGGRTAFIDYKGRPMTEASADREECIYGYVDLDELNEFRAKFPALDDADRFELK